MKIKLILSIIIVALLTSCTQVVVNTADEIRLNKWSAETKGGAKVKLSFNEDIGELKISSDKDSSDAVIKGVCSIDDRYIFIYNNSEQEPYFFKYKINNNKLNLLYDGGKLTLIREN